jgi:hypothetical protein
LKLKKDASAICGRLSSVLTQWGISEEKLAGVVTDNEAAYCRAVKDLHAPHYRCAIHTLQLAVRAAPVDAGLNSEVVKLREVVSTFNRSSKLGDALEDEITAFYDEKARVPKEAVDAHTHKKGRVEDLIMDVATRWNSTYDMMDRLLDLERPVRAVCNRKDLWSDELPMLTDTDFDFIRAVLPPLKAAKDATEILCGEKFVTASKVYIVFAGLLRFHLADEPSDPYVRKELKKFLRVHILAQWNDKLDNDDMLLSTFMDPTVFRMGIFPPELLARAKERIIARVGSSTAHAEPKRAVSAGHGADSKETAVLLGFLGRQKRPEAPTAASDDAEVPSHFSIRLEVDKYFAEAQLASSAMGWWKEAYLRFPALWKVASRYLVVPASSTPSERVFSDAGFVMEAKRSKLTDEHFNMSLFLYHNLRLTECGLLEQEEAGAHSEANVVLSASDDGVTEV